MLLDLQVSALRGGDRAVFHGWVYLSSLLLGMAIQHEGVRVSLSVVVREEEVLVDHL